MLLLIKQYTIIVFNLHGLNMLYAIIIMQVVLNNNS